MDFIRRDCFEAIFVDDAADTPVEYGIRNIPTLLFFKNGELKDKLVGSTTKAAIADKLNALL